MPRFESRSDLFRRTLRETRYRNETRPHLVEISLHVFLKGKRGPYRLLPFSGRYQVNPRKNPQSQAVRNELLDKARRDAVKANSIVPPENLEITLKTYAIL